jgi:hypothetical protein
MTEHDARDGGPENRELHDVGVSHQETFAESVPANTWQAYNLDTLNFLLDP